MFVPCLIFFLTCIFVIVTCKVETNFHVCRTVSTDINFVKDSLQTTIYCMYVYVYILSIRSSGRASEEKGRVHIELTVTLTSVQIHAICMMTLHCYCNTIDLHSTF